MILSDFGISPGLINESKNSLRKDKAGKQENNQDVAKAAKEGDGGHDLYWRFWYSPEKPVFNNKYQCF
jgi:hypothetical protein